MSGAAEQSGVAQLCTRDIFDAIEASAVWFEFYLLVLRTCLFCNSSIQLLCDARLQSSDREFLLRVSMCEIYNERIWCVHSAQPVACPRA